MLKRALLVAFGVSLLVAGVTAQQSTSIDPIRELLVEVRGLRAAMERSATVGARVQLLVARIQLQEQRISELSRRLAQVRTELRDAEGQMNTFAPMMKMFDNDKMPPEERDAFNHQLEMMKGQLALQEKRRTELTQEEGFLTQQLSEEQGRWTTINEQLDALERSLMTGK